MFVNKYSFLRKLLTAAIVSIGFSAGISQAATSTGEVQWYFTQDYGTGEVYTFVNIAPGIVCYYIGDNTALASIFATTQNAGGTVRVNCDGSHKITQVAN